MSERAMMKSRVRGLLHREWLAPLGAMVLAGLPMIVTAAAVLLLARSISVDAPSITAQLRDMFAGADSVEKALIMLMYQFKLDMTRPIAQLPLYAALLGVSLFAGCPVAVSMSGYFNNLLRGKNPKVTSVFSCFSGAYPRALGGMLYMLLWVMLWALAAFAGPVLLYVVGLRIIEFFAEQLGLYQLHVLGGLVIACVVCFFVFVYMLLNRVVAYSLTSVCLAAQPRLPARRATRLSRKLLRGNKWRLIGLCFSFIRYFLPAIAAGVLLLLVPALSNLFAFSESVQWMVRLVLWIIIFANQCAWLYVLPYAAACFHAFYIERKREALLDAEVNQDDFAVGPTRVKAAHATRKRGASRRKTPYDVREAQGPYMNTGTLPPANLTEKPVEETAQTNAPNAKKGQ